MRKSMALTMLVAGLAAGLLWAADPPTGGNLPAGFMPKELKDQADERMLLVRITQAALTKGGFNEMIMSLSTPDRKRIAEFTNRDSAKLDGRLEQINKVWLEKYGKKFDFDNDKIMESFVVIREGEVSDPVVAKMNWPVSVTERPIREAGLGDPLTSAEYLTKGRNVAIATIPASHGLPAMHLSLLHENIDYWRLDLPDSITGEQVYQNLLTRLTMLGENVSSWPADVNEAYRLVAHNVLAAVTNVQAETRMVPRTSAQ